MTDARPEARGPAPTMREGRRMRGSLTGRALILALVVVALFVALAVPVRTWFAQRAEIAQLRADVVATRERVEELRIEQERWQDPAFVAAEARRRLHFVLPGEVGYVAIGTEDSPEEAAALAAAVAVPWYATLWGAVRQADDPVAGPGQRSTGPAGANAGTSGRADSTDGTDGTNNTNSTNSTNSTDGSDGADPGAGDAAPDG
jgi:cell division protein FtsB